MDFEQTTFALPVEDREWTLNAESEYMMKTQNEMQSQRQHRKVLTLININSLFLLDLLQLCFVIFEREKVYQNFFLGYLWFSIPSLSYLSLPQNVYEWCSKILNMVK